MATMIVCKECNREMQHRAKGLCGTCYEKKRAKHITCPECGKYKRHHCKGMCGGCYNRTRKKNPSIVICSDCGKEAPLRGYGMCENCYSRWWGRKNPDKIKKANAKQIATNKEGRYESYKKWVANNQEQRKITNKRSRIKHREKYNQRNKEWRTKNRQRHIDNSNAWRENNRERSRINNRMSHHRRKARMAGLVHDLTEQQWIEILELYGNICAYCGCSDPLQQEHVSPPSHGGGYTKSNIIPACKVCNGTKSDMHLKDFVDHMEDIGEELNLHPMVCEKFL